MNIALDADVQKFVEQKVKSGQFASLQEPINGLLLHLRSLEELSPDGVDELRAELDIGIAEADRGQFVQFTAEDIIAERHAALAARKDVS